jgi:thiol-disulfide isomerase/thioredoxin
MNILSLARSGGVPSHGRAMSVAVVLALTLLAGSPSSAAAQAKPAPSPSYKTGDSCPVPSKDAPLRDFKLINDLFLEVGGQRVASEIYRSDSAGAVLVISSALPWPAVLRATSVASVDPAAIEKGSDGVVNVKTGAVVKPRGAFQIAGDEVTFTADSRQATLRPTPPLLGLRRAEEVTAFNPEYVERIGKYAPDARALAALKKERREVRVRIFYGSWCPHCAMLVPHALKVEQELGASKIHFEYYGVPRHFGSDPELKKVGLKGIPTAVVYVEGQEVGRILDDDSWETPESALRAILEGKGGLGAGR